MKSKRESRRIRTHKISPQCEIESETALLLGGSNEDPDNYNDFIKQMKQESGQDKAEDCPASPTPQAELLSRDSASRDDIDEDEDEDDDDDPDHYTESANDSSIFITEDLPSSSQANGDVVRVFPCQRCEFTTDVRWRLTMHVKRVHMGRTFRCNHCDGDKRFNDQQTLNRHLRLVHLGLRAFECDKCSYSTDQKTHLSRHVKVIHEGTVSFACEQCDFTTRYKPTLKSHVAVRHGGERTVKCDQCSFTACFDRQLRVHLRMVHAVVKDFKCDQCVYATNSRADLKKHVMIVHEKIRNFLCNLCDYAASTSGNLKDHVMRVHETARPFLCPLCSSYSTASNSALKGHIKTKHGNSGIFNCRQCEFLSDNHRRWAAHVRARHVNKSDGVYQGQLFNFGGDVPANEGSIPLISHYKLGDIDNFAPASVCTLTLTVDGQEKGCLRVSSPESSLVMKTVQATRFIDVASIKEEAEDPLVQTQEDIEGGEKDSTAHLQTQS